MLIRLYLFFVFTSAIALGGCDSSCIFDSCRECAVPVRATEFARSLRDTTLTLGGDPLELYALGGENPMFEVVGNGEPDLWSLRAHNPPPDSGIFRYEIDDEIYGLHAQDRIVIEALKPGRDGILIWAQPVDQHDCGSVDVRFIIHVVE